MVRPSGLARRVNWFAPAMEPPPGMFLTTTLGLPGRCCESSGAKNRAQRSGSAALLEGDYPLDGLAGKIRRARGERGDGQQRRQQEHGAKTDSAFHFFLFLVCVVKKRGVRGAAPGWFPGSVRDFTANRRAKQIFFIRRAVF